MKKISMYGKVAAALLAMGALVATLSSAEAQENNRRRRRNVVRLEDRVIEGRIQKPQAFYILQRSNLNFEGLELKNSFVKRIVESVDEAPF